MTIAFIIAGAWFLVFFVTLAMCRAAGRADAASDGAYAAPASRERTAPAYQTLRAGLSSLN